MPLSALRTLTFRTHMCAVPSSSMALYPRSLYCGPSEVWLQPAVGVSEGFRWELLQEARVRKPESHASSNSGPQRSLKGNREALHPAVLYRRAVGMHGALRAFQDCGGVAGGGQALIQIRGEELEQRAEGAQPLSTPTPRLRTWEGQVSVESDPAGAHGNHPAPGRQGRQEAAAARQ